MSLMTYIITPRANQSYVISSSAIAQFAIHKLLYGLTQLVTILAFIYAAAATKPHLSMNKRKKPLKPF